MNKDPYYQAFKVELDERVLTPLFAKLRNPKIKTSKRKALQNAVLRLVDKYFLYVTNYSAALNDENVVCDPAKQSLLSPLFVDTLAMIISHPDFSWAVWEGESLGKPGGLTLSASDSIADLIPNDVQLQNKIRHLVEFGW